MQGFHRDTWAEVNLDYIYENVVSMKKILPQDVKMFAVVKANAYGHGDYEVANTALKAGANFLAVAFLDEALALRNKGITAPILVLGASRPEDAGMAAEAHISLTVFSQEWLEQAKQYVGEKQVLHVHIKCDSGMGRIGVRTPEELQALEQWLSNELRFRFVGVFTHFATADELNLSYYQQQLNTFKMLLSSLRKLPELVHAANSAASLRFTDPLFNAVRFGISMYGLSPSLDIKQLLPFTLKEAFSLKTKIVHVKRLNKGDHVSYGATYTAAEEEWVATLPIGYADGWIRKLRSQDVIVAGEKAPIVGRICMDQCMIKLSQPLPIGTEVTLIGESDGLAISVDEIAATLETINYEVTCMIAARVPRVYRQNQQVSHVRNTLLDD
ncbi:alanine racemase [Peribacillus asahii]|nr:alanine racemase [Peribacillus asahii]USK87202.1 alanine racemase [Peribacillus asahii]